MKQGQVEILIGKLLDCGYHNYQIKQIISDAVESNAKDNDEAQEQLIIDALESYLRFAAKCKTTEKSKI